MSNITFEDIKALMGALLRNKLLIALFVLAGLCAGMLYSARNQEVRTYYATASISVVFTMDANQIQGPAVLANYANMVNSIRVAEYAAELLTGEGISARQILDMTTTVVQATSHMLTITVRGESPRHTILAVNAIAESFVAQISFITGTSALRVFERATYARLSRTDSSNMRVLAPTAAFVIAVLLVFIMELLSGKVRSVRQCVDDMGELLAVIPEKPDLAAKKTNILNPKRGKK